jgi:hypothetical protein
MNQRAPGFLVSAAYLAEQHTINNLVRYELGLGTRTYEEPMPGAKRPDVRLVRTPPDGIKGMRYTDPIIYGVDCDCVDIYDSTDMVAEATKAQRRLQYLKVDSTRVKQFVLNPNVNPVPGYQIVQVDQTVYGEYVVVGSEWELDAIVAADFSEPSAYNTPRIATVNVLECTGDPTVDAPGTPVYKVTPYTLKVVVRGKGLNLDKGVPCRIRTVGGVWRFSWVDCEVDEVLRGQLTAPEPYPDKLEPEE